MAPNAKRHRASASEGTATFRFKKERKAFVTETVEAVAGVVDEQVPPVWCQRTQSRRHGSQGILGLAAGGATADPVTIRTMKPGDRRQAVAVRFRPPRTMFRVRRRRLWMVGVVGTLQTGVQAILSITAGDGLAAVLWGAAALATAGLSVRLETLKRLGGG